MIQNKVQLISYPNSLGNNLKDLYYVLETYLKDYIGGIHILPFYPSSGDRGFCPLTHLFVEEEFGTWNDIKKIAKEYDLMVDLVINHISIESKYFLDYLEKGKDSKYSGLFLSMANVFPKGKVKKRQLDKIYRPRPSVPYYPITFADGSTKHLWTSFNSDQIDLNWNNEITFKIMEEFLLKLVDNGAKIIRLDAVGYIIKKLGTNSFFLPEVYDIIDNLKESVKDKDIKFLPEVHKDYILQLEIAKNSDYTYDFSLPPLILYSMHFMDFTALKTWIKIRPINQINVLDTHDGIGIVDVDGQLKKRQIQKLKEKLYMIGGNAALRASGENSQNLDVYQINATFFSALSNDENAYLFSRAIQFFIPGIPQVYYVGLFAGVNDIELLSKTNIGRDINRHNYTLKEIEKEIEKPVVKSLLNMMKFRNEYIAFSGKFELYQTDKEKIALKWKKNGYECILEGNSINKNFKISYKEKINDKFVWKELDLALENTILQENINKQEKKEKISL